MLNWLSPSTSVYWAEVAQLGKCSQPRMRKMETPPDTPPRKPPEDADSATVSGALHKKSSPRRLLVLLTAAGTLFLIALGTWSAYWADMRNDQYQLLQVGQCVYSGGTLYVDCWENKPPGIAWINALGVALGGGGEFVAWLLPGLSCLLSVAVLGLAVGQALSRTAACATVIVASVVFTLRMYDTVSINPDFYSAALELSACSLWVLAFNGSRKWRRLLLGLLAGLLWAGAVTVKQTGLVGLLAITTVTIVLCAVTKLGARRWLATTACAWAGFALGLVAVAGVLAKAQTLGIAVDAVFRFNTGLLGAESVVGLLDAWPRMRPWVQPLALPLWLGLIGVIATIRSDKSDRLSSSFVVAMLIWWVLQAVLALLGPSRSMRYWQATFPAMLWLGGIGIFHIEAIFRQVGKRHRLALSVICVTVVVLLGRPLFDDYTFGLARSLSAYSQDPTERHRLSAIGEEIQTLVPKGERIYVWAYDAGIYVHARRLGASRFNHPRSAAQMREILNALESGKARALIIPEVRSYHFDRWCDDGCRRKFDEILNQFEENAPVDGYRIWTYVGPRNSDAD